MKDIVSEGKEGSRCIVNIAEVARVRDFANSTSDWSIIEIF